MADRTSAYLFGTTFEHLAKTPTEDNKKFAKWLWEQARNYDFSTYQMECDEALAMLGIEVDDG